jgi:hypothetical protein
MTFDLSQFADDFVAVKAKPRAIDRFIDDITAYVAAGGDPMTPKSKSTNDLERSLFSRRTNFFVTAKALREGRSDVPMLKMDLADVDRMEAIGLVISRRRTRNTVYTPEALVENLAKYVAATGDPNPDAGIEFDDFPLGAVLAQAKAIDNGGVSKAYGKMSAITDAHWAAMPGTTRATSEFVDGGMVNVVEAATLTGLGRGTIRNGVKDGVVKSATAGLRATTWIDRDEVLSWIVPDGYDSCAGAARESGLTTESVRRWGIRHEESVWVSPLTGRRFINVADYLARDEKRQSTAAVCEAA